MPPQTVSCRPQTSRQARRAYQKAGGAPRLSVVEQRRLERSAELQERAARIKAHNDRAKENKRKKAEKLEREREARKRMGIPEPTRFKVGSSQLDLGTFVSAGVKRKREESDRLALSLESCPKIGDSIPNEDTVKLAEITPGQTEPLPKASSTETAVARQTNILPREEKQATIATTASLMPPPPLPQPPLRKIPGNPMVQPGCQPPNTNIGIIGTDWDSLFDSNTQVERDISDTKEKPPSPTSLPKATPNKPMSPPLTVQSDLLTNISTQDLQYSSSPPPTTRNATKRRPEFGVEKKYKESVSSSLYSDERVAQGLGARSRQPVLLPAEEPTSPMKKRRPSSSLRHDEIDVIILALEDEYCVWLSHSDIERLITGRYLGGLASAVPPWLVTNMAIKLEELRQNGERLWTAHKLLRWTSKMRQIEVPERRRATAKFAAAALATMKEAIAQERLDANGRLLGHLQTEFAMGKSTIVRPNPKVLDTRAVSKGAEVRDPKSFDEFDQFEVSSQDLLELEI